MKPPAESGLVVPQSDRAGLGYSDVLRGLSQRCKHIHADESEGLGADDVGLEIDLDEPYAILEVSILDNPHRVRS